MIHTCIHTHDIELCSTGRAPEGDVRHVHHEQMGSERRDSDALGARVIHPAADQWRTRAFHLPCAPATQFHF